MDLMQAVSADPRVPEPAPENFGISEGLRRRHINNEVLERFAENVTENIIQSLMSKMETMEHEMDFRVSRFNHNQEMLAEELASAVIEDALREVCRDQNIEGFQSSRSAWVKMDGAQAFMDQTEGQRDFLDEDTTMDPGKEIQTSKDTQPCHPPLSQSGLPIVGSLDYPDAPPTTPLLPELERSRQSFARKLKGGLAKVFLPSPPPPTPKDKEDDSDSATNDLRMELMEHLMHSLATDNLPRDYFEEGPQHGAKMETFAEALSCDIIDWVLSTKTNEQTADDSELYLLARQLAITIITSSLDEAKMMQAVSPDPRVPEPSPENACISEGLRRIHLNNEVLERFAQNMTENIIQSLMSQRETMEHEMDFRVSRFNYNQEMLAEELASAVIEDALREVCRGQNIEGFQRSRSTWVKMDGGQAFVDQSKSQRAFLDEDTAKYPGKAIGTSKDTQPCHPPLSQSGLPVAGSLDYPDAPPTTPLLPELERSRQSFARKLKGGLAKVFLPSPPPPTPKEKEDDSDSTSSDLQMELMEHLMHSLSTDDLRRDRIEVGPYHGAKMEAFAEALSCDIIDWVLRAKNSKQTTDDSDLHLLAHQLSETIITSSLDEAKMIV